MGSDLSLVLQTSVNAPDSIVQNHKRIITTLRKASRQSRNKNSNGNDRRGESYTFEDDPMNYVELRVMASEDARAFVHGDAVRNARAMSLERAGAGGNEVLLLEPSCDTNSMSGVSSDPAAIAARGKGYTALRRALKDPLMAGRVGIAIDASAKLGNRIPAHSGRFTQCASLLLANVLLAAEGSNNNNEGEGRRSQHYSLPRVTLYALDLRECGLDDESGPWIVKDFMERVKRVFRFHVGLRLQQAQKHRQSSLFPQPTALGLYTGTPHDGDSEDEDDDASAALQRLSGGSGRDFTVQVPVFTKDTRGDLLCCSLQHLLMTDNNIEIGGVLHVVNALLEAVAPKGYAPKGEDWMLLPYLCLIDLQKQDVLPSEIRQYLLEYVPPTKQVVILVSGTLEAEWKSTKERAEEERQNPRQNPRTSSRGRRSLSRGRERVDKPEDFKQVYILQDHSPMMDLPTPTARDDGNEGHDGRRLSSARGGQENAGVGKKEEEEAEEEEQLAVSLVGSGSSSASSRSSISFRIDGNDVSSLPPSQAPTPSAVLHSTPCARPIQHQSPSTADGAPQHPEQLQEQLRAESAAYVESQRSRRQSLAAEQQHQQQQQQQQEEEEEKRRRAEALRRQIHEEEAQLAVEQRRLGEIRQRRESTAKAADAEQLKHQQQQNNREDKLKDLHQQRQDLQRQQREMYEEQEREALDDQLARRDRRQKLPQDQQIVILREKPPSRSGINKRELEERLQRLFEEEQAVYREYEAAEEEERANAAAPPSPRTNANVPRDRKARTADAQARNWLQEQDAAAAPSADATPSRSSTPSIVTGNGTPTPVSQKQPQQQHDNKGGSPSPSATTRDEVRLPGEVSPYDEPQTYDSSSDNGKVVTENEPEETRKVRPTCRDIGSDIPRVIKTRPGTVLPSKRAAAQATSKRLPVSPIRPIQKETSPTAEERKEEQRQEQELIVATEPLESDEEYDNSTNISNSNEGVDEDYDEAFDYAPLPSAQLESPQEGEERSPRERDEVYIPLEVDGAVPASANAASTAGAPDNDNGEDKDIGEEENVISPFTSRDRSPVGPAGKSPSRTVVSDSEPEEEDDDGEEEKYAAARPQDTPTVLVSAPSSRASVEHSPSQQQQPQRRSPPRRVHIDPTVVAEATGETREVPPSPSQQPVHDPDTRSPRQTGSQFHSDTNISNNDDALIQVPASLQGRPEEDYDFENDEHNIMPWSTSNPRDNSASATSSRRQANGARVLPLRSDPDDVYARDPDFAREREDRVRRYRDHRYDSVSPRVDTRWESGADRPASQPCEAPKKIRDPPRTAASGRMRSEESGLTSPQQHQKTKKSQDEEEEEPIVVVSPPSRKSSMATGPEMRARSPRLPPGETAASRARRTVSQQRRANEEAEAEHRRPHQPRINRSSASPRIDAAAPQSRRPSEATAALTTPAESPKSFASGRTPRAREESPRARPATTTAASRNGTTPAKKQPPPPQQQQQPLLISSPAENTNANGEINSARRVNDAKAGLVWTPQEPSTDLQRRWSSDVNGLGISNSDDYGGAFPPQRPGVEAPPGWGMPMVNTRLRTQRPSQR